jgi:hypothetical protein
VREGGGEEEEEEEEERGQKASGRFEDNERVCTTYERYWQLC